jgi:sulfite reductase (NADPH) hemoprotein beta-component
MNKLYAEDLDHAGIAAALDPLFAAYTKERQKGERFGDFVIRTGHIAASGNGADFHSNVRLPPVTNFSAHSRVSGNPEP